MDAQAAAAVTAAGQAVKTSFVTFFLDATAWEGSAAPYSLSIPISALTSEKLARVTPIYSGANTAQDLAMRDACAAITYAKRTQGGITFTCLAEKPTVDIPVTAEIYV